MGLIGLCNFQWQTCLNFKNLVRHMAPIYFLIFLYVLDKVYRHVCIPLHSNMPTDPDTLGKFIVDRNKSLVLLLTGFQL